MATLLTKAAFDWCMAYPEPLIHFVCTTVKAVDLGTQRSKLNVRLNRRPYCLRTLTKPPQARQWSVESQMHEPPKLEWCTKMYRLQARKTEHPHQGQETIISNGSKLLYDKKCLRDKFSTCCGTNLTTTQRRSGGTFEIYDQAQRVWQKKLHPWWNPNGDWKQFLENTMRRKRVPSKFLHCLNRLWLWGMRDTARATCWEGDTEENGQKQHSELIVSSLVLYIQAYCTVWIISWFSPSYLLYCGKSRLFAIVATAYSKVDLIVFDPTYTARNGE